MESSYAYSLKSGRDQEFFFFQFCQGGGHPIIVHNRDGPNLARGQTPNTIFLGSHLCGDLSLSLSLSPL
jgi:hypothetical protein